MEANQEQGWTTPKLHLEEYKILEILDKESAGEDAWALRREVAGNLPSWVPPRINRLLKHDWVEFISGHGDGRQSMGLLIVGNCEEEATVMHSSLTNFCCHYFRQVSEKPFTTALVFSPAYYRNQQGELSGKAIVKTLCAQLMLAYATKLSANFYKTSAPRMWQEADSTRGLNNFFVSLLQQVSAYAGRREEKHRIVVIIDGLNLLEPTQNFDIFVSEIRGLASKMMGDSRFHYVEFRYALINPAMTTLRGMRVEDNIESTLDVEALPPIMTEFAKDTVSPPDYNTSYKTKPELLDDWGDVKRTTADVHPQVVKTNDGSELEAKPHPGIRIKTGDDGIPLVVDGSGSSRPYIYEPAEYKPSKGCSMSDIMADLGQYGTGSPPRNTSRVPSGHIPPSPDTGNVEESEVGIEFFQDGQTPSRYPSATPSSPTSSVISGAQRQERARKGLILPTINVEEADEDPQPAPIAAAPASFEDSFKYLSTSSPAVSTSRPSRSLRNQQLANISKITARAEAESSSSRPTASSSQTGVKFKGKGRVKY